MDGCKPLQGGLRVDRHLRISKDPEGRVRVSVSVSVSVCVLSCAICVLPYHSFLWMSVGARSRPLSLSQTSPLPSFEPCPPVRPPAVLRFSPHRQDREEV